VTPKSKWILQTEENPGHSDWYIERFRKLAADGADLHGEARMIDAMVERGARILDAGCGPGRLGGRLTELGHTVVGVDVDPALIEAANQDHPHTQWIVGDLAELDLASHGIEPFDVIVAAGNVMAFLAPETRRDVLANLRHHLAENGRLVVGFGAGRDYDFDEFWAYADEVGLRAELRLSTWDLRPFQPDSDFLVAVLARA